MLITTAHLLALKELAGSEATHTSTADDPQEHIYRVLELQGLVQLEVPRAYQLTYAGREALRILDAMRKAALLPPPDRLKNDWHFLGSDILAALYAARQNRGWVGPQTVHMLNARGLTERVHDTLFVADHLSEASRESGVGGLNSKLEKRSYVRLNQHGEAWLDFAERYRPRLEINGDLANSIHHMHPGYTGRPDANMPSEHLDLLEAMDLLTWSVPEGTIYALTTLGQAVYEALRKGGGYVPLDTVLDEPTLELLALLVNRGSAALTSEQMTNLQMLGYVELDGTVSAAGQAALRAYALLLLERPQQIRSFAITEAEVELLAAVQHIVERPNDSHSSQLLPDKKTLHRVLVDRMVKRYEELVGRYGRTIQERSAKKRQALELLEHMKDHDEWFDRFWALDELLMSLEAFDLLHAEVEETKTVYRLTPNGLKVVAEQGQSPRDITAMAVKVLTTAIARLHAPADSWIEQAREEGLIGTGGVSKSGRLYAELAKHSTRIPALTRDEAEVLEQLPETVRESSTYAARDYSSPDEEKQDWALEKLEARGLIERLVDGQIVRTEAGQLLVKAVSGARQLGHPVTPEIARLLAAIRQVRTLYVTEQKVRTEPHNWAEVERLTGLGRQEFKEAVHVARMGQYIGEVNLTEAGLELLSVQELLNRKPAYGKAI